MNGLNDLITLGASRGVRGRTQSGVAGQFKKYPRGIALEIREDLRPAVAEPR
ncbi:MAG: hypothetical protein ACREOG_22875 [Gemmatimonadaceae bacterium]